VIKFSIYQGVRQGWPLSPTLFSLYIDDITIRYQIELEDKCYINNIEINTVLFADDQVILGKKEGNRHRTIHRLNVISEDYNMRISIDKTKGFSLERERPHKN
jgi:hypothetical protein